MRAIVARKTGPPEVLQLEEIEMPTPKSNEVLIRVHATTVTAGDVILRGLRFPLNLVFSLPGLRKYRKDVPGHEFAGEIEAVGEEVKRFEEGDQVFGTTTGFRFGSYAEYIALPEDSVLAMKPANKAFEEAAALPIGGMAALQILRRGRIQPRDKVLIYGASGSVGSFAVQLAKHFGGDVTGVTSTKNVEMVKSLGADVVIDYTKEDFTKSGVTYDVIFDAVGKISSSRAKGSLSKGGHYLSVVSSTSEEIEDLMTIKELAETGKIRAVIDRRYPLEDIVEAHRYVDQGHKRGNVVITVKSDS